MLFEDGTEIDDNGYFLALDRRVFVLIYQRSDSKHYDFYFLVKLFLSGLYLYSQVWKSIH